MMRTNGQGLVVTGESGGGRRPCWRHGRGMGGVASRRLPLSALLWRHPGKRLRDGFLRRLLGELKSRFDITEEIPTDPEKLREALPLCGANGQPRKNLCFDGLNRYRAAIRPPSNLLLFFPAPVTVIASSLPGPGLDALRERGWTEHELPPCRSRRSGRHGRRLSDLHARTLDASRERQLVIAPGSKPALSPHAAGGTPPVRQFRTTARPGQALP